MLFIYRSLINVIYPFLIIIIFLRVFFKKESKQRYKEKLFSSSFNVKRDLNKKLIWFHVASIGEFNSIVPIINELNKKNTYQFLITSVTLSSANLISKDLLKKKNIFHRFFPVDQLNLVEKFLDNWAPNLIFFVDSEVWPNFLLEIKRRKINSILLNGRITRKTFKRWMMVKGFANEIFNTFNLCLASSNESKTYLDILNARNVKFFGNLKFSTSINFKNVKTKNNLSLKKNKFWCAASTHKGEEIFCLKTHLILKKKLKKITTIIIPRHIHRSYKIESLCRKYNLSSQLLNRNEIIDSKKEVIKINSFGVLLKYFKEANSVFIGKSILKHFKSAGGQNPIEAAKLGCKIYHGPFIYNFADIYKLLKKYKICEMVSNERELSKKLIKDFKRIKPKEKIKIKIINNLGEKILKRSLIEINKISKL